MLQGYVEINFLIHQSYIIARQDGFELNGGFHA